MASTTYTEIVSAVAALQDRTDAGGTGVTDVNGEDLRLFAQLLSGGVLTGPEFAVAPGTGMQVLVGSGVDGADVGVVSAVAADQGHYIVRQDLGSVPVTVPAADLAQGRIDEVYLIVADDAYDSGGVTLARLGYREGDLGGGAPGPDAGWDAYLLLATVTIGAGITSISGGAISDERVLATLRTAIDLVTSGAASEDDLTAHTGSAGNPHATNWGNLFGKPAEFPPEDHFHTATDTNAGTFNNQRLPDASTSAKGAVRLVDNLTNSGVDVALTANQGKVLKDLVDTKSPSTHDHGRYYYANATTGQRVITVSGGSPSGGANGDIWLQV